MKWPTALAVTTAIVAVAVVAALGRDTATLAGVIGLLLGGGAIFSRVEQVREHVNGNASRLLDIIERQSTAPPPSAPPNGQAGPDPQPGSAP